MTKESKAINHSRNYVYISPQARGLMSLWASMAGRKGYEMTCWATTNEDDGVIVVDNAYIVKHKGTAGDVEADDVDTALLVSRLVAEGYKPEQINCWVHSHPGKGPSATYLSSIDEDNIERWLTGDYLVSIVWDSAGENPYCRVDFKRPRLSVVCDLEVDLRLHEEVFDQAVKDFEEKSQKKTVYIPTKVKEGKSGSPRTFLGEPIIQRPPIFSGQGFDIQQGFDFADDEAFERWFTYGDIGGDDEDEKTESQAQKKEEGKATKRRALTYDKLTVAQIAKVTSVCAQLMEKEISAKEAIEQIVSECKCSNHEAKDILSDAIAVDIDLDEQVDDEEDFECVVSQKIVDEICEAVWSGKMSFADGCIQAQRTLDMSFKEAVLTLQHEIDITTEDVKKELTLAGLREDGSRIASKAISKAIKVAPQSSTFKPTTTKTKKDAV